MLPENNIVPDFPFLKIESLFPSKIHADIAERAAEFFAQYPETQAFLLTCSCVRGNGIRDIDFEALAHPETTTDLIELMEFNWNKAKNEDPLFTAFMNMGKFYNLDLSVTKGIYKPRELTLSEGPDDMELKVGNTFIYSFPLWERSNQYYETKRLWLPYYDENLRNTRLKDAIARGRESIDYIEWDHSRGHHILAQQRLGKAVEYFLQALFIDRKKYPFAYNKWIQEQLENLLNLPELYPELLFILANEDLRSDQVIENGQALADLFEAYIEENHEVPS